MSAGEATDRDAIRELLARYARALDERDWEALAACFTPDAQAEYSGVVLEPGVAAIVRHVEQLAGIPASTHLVGNVLIRLRGDEADVDSQAVVHLVLEQGSRARVRVRGLFYSDVVRRVAGEWRIADRRHRADWSIELG